jgi:hypothetical protein
MPVLGEPDKQGGMLVNETGVAMVGAPDNPAKGKRRAEKGTAKRGMVALAK